MSEPTPEQRVYNATKTAMRQGSNGIEVTIKFNLDGDEIDLVALPLGGRMFITCKADLATKVDIRKVPEARSPTDGPAMLQAPVGHMPILDPVRHAAMLARDPDFQAWVFGQTGMDSQSEIMPDKMKEMYVGNWMRERLRINSRADLAVRQDARNRYDILLSEYRSENPNDGPDAA
jgi:hypothetical protein